LSTANEKAGAASSGLFMSESRSFRRRLVQSAVVRISGSGP
jgi:hypothetical protein